MDMMWFPRTKTRGASLSEYMIILALVAVVAIPVVSMMGGMLNNQYATNDPTTKAKDLYALLDANAPTEATAPVGQERDGNLNDLALGDTTRNDTRLADTAIEQTGGPGGADLQNVGARSAEMTYADVQLQEQTELLDETSTMVTTSAQGVQEIANNISGMGAAYTTDSLADQMEDFADQAEEAGTLTEAQAKKIRALSNQGHKIAEVQEILEEAVEDAGDDLQKLNNTSFEYNGQKYSSPLHLAWKEVGFTQTPMYDHSPMDAPGAGREMKKFQQLYHDAVQSGALDDPEVNDTITHLADQIGQIGESTDHIFSEMKYKTTTTTGKAIESPQQFNELMGSQVTHQNSKGICTTGGAGKHGKSGTRQYCH